MEEVYYALTHVDNDGTGRTNWSPLFAVGTDPVAVRKSALEDIGEDEPENEYANEERKNLVIVPAERLPEYGWSVQDVNARIEWMSVLVQTEHDLASLIAQAKKVFGHE